ncbi:MAG: cobalamin-dependent protein [Pseudomonadota bacterium]
MSNNSRLDTVIDRTRLEATSHKLRSFKRSLPENELTHLAKDVLNRLAKRRVSASKPFAEASETDVEKLARSLIRDDLDQALQIAMKIQEKGLRVEEIYIGLLAAAARKLGEWWDDDAISLVDVTIGTSQIFGIMREFDKISPPAVSVSEKSALFIAAPDETHTIGVNMAANLFEREGWQIRLLVGLDHETVISEVVRDKHPIIGISSGGQHSLADLARLILSIRIERPHAFLLVSGNVVNQYHGQLEAMMPDAIAKDVPTAMAVMETYWTELLQKH